MRRMGHCAPTLTNRLLWLRLLDEGDTASNGICTTDAVAQALQGRSLDFGAAPVAFDAAAKALLPAQVNDVHGQPYGARVIGARRALAVEHFEGTLATALGRRDTSATNQLSAGGEVRITKYTLAALASQGVPYEGDNAAAKRDFPTGFALAVGSGLAYKGTTADGKPTDKVKVRDFAPFARWLDFDPATEQSRLYAYPLDYPLAAAGGRWDRNRTGSAKLGDLVALGQGRYIVIEQGADQDGKVRNFLMLVQRATDVTDIAGLGYELEQNAIDGATASAVAWTDVVPLKKTLLLDLNAAGWMAEKAEGLALVDAQTLALINDNDFGLRSILFDAVGKEVAGDPTECTVDAAGAIVADGKCASGAVGVRVARGSDTERPTRVWLLRFPKALTAYTVP